MLSSSKATRSFILPSYNFKTVPQGFRRFSNYLNRNIVILGNSNVGFGIAQQALKKGFQVFITSRSKQTTTDPLKKIHYIQTPEKEVLEKKFWKQLTKVHFPKEGKLTVVNTIGGSIAKNCTMQELNADIPVAAVQGITDYLKENQPNRKFNVVQISTMAAAGLNAAYGATKRDAEEKLMALLLEHLTILRLGYALEPYIDQHLTQTYKSQHQISMEELSVLPLNLLVADPKQYNRVTVPIVSIQDVATAILNLQNETAQKRIIDAVNYQKMTQEQFCKFMTDLLGKPFKPVYIPIDAAKKLAEHHPFGHVIPYAVEHCEMKHGIELNPEEFQKLVGTPLKTLKEMYQLQPGQKLLLPRPPFIQFIAQFLKNTLTNPSSIKDSSIAIAQVAKALLFRPKVDFVPLECPAPKEGYPWSTLTEKAFNHHSEENRESFTELAK